MKRGHILFTACMAFSIALASCTEKQYTCQCSGGISGGTTEISVIARNRVSAKNQCNNYTNPPGTPDGLTCNIKD